MLAAVPAAAAIATPPASVAVTLAVARLTVAARAASAARHALHAPTLVALAPWLRWLDGRRADGLEPSQPGMSHVVSRRLPCLVRTHPLSRAL